jgi:hypothetical protein
MVNTFDRSLGGQMPTAACFQMTDAEFAIVLRGWKLPSPLGEEMVVRDGTNPFTGASMRIVGRIRLSQPAPADADAVRSPSLWHLPWIDMEETHGEQFDLLAMVLFGWSRAYASFEVSGAYVVGPQDANDWFLLLPERFVDALAAIEMTKLQNIAALWSASTSDLDPDAAERLLARLVPFGKLARERRRRVFFGGSR